MGRRFSIDALRKQDETKDTRPVASIAVLAILLELSVIYYFNAVNKHGWTWRRGLAVYYVLYQERMITWFGLLLRSIMTVPLSRVLSYAVLAIEYAAPILLLVPFQRVRLRRIAIVLFPALHLAFAAGLNLGQFSFNMVGYFPLLLSAEDWSALGRRFAPLGSWFASSERWMARFLRVTRSPLAPSKDELAAIPARGWLLRRAAEMRELAAFVLLFAVTWQLFVENHAIPQRYKFPQPKWIAGLVVYPRLLQGWQMFSADVPTGERMLYVDAATFGGRHVDPFNEAGSRVANLPVDTIPRHMQQDEFWCDYTNRIPENEAYWRAFKEWVFSYHLRTGRPEDRIISFEAHLLEHEEPAPGETGPKNVRTKVIMHEHE